MMDAQGMQLHPADMLHTDNRQPQQASMAHVTLLALVAEQNKDVALVHEFLCFVVNSTVDTQDGGLKLVSDNSAVSALDGVMVSGDFPPHSGPLAIKQVAVDPEDRVSYTSSIIAAEKLTGRVAPSGVGSLAASATAH